MSSSSLRIIRSASPRAVCTPTLTVAPSATHRIISTSTSPAAPLLPRLIPQNFTRSTSTTSHTPITTTTTTSSSSFSSSSSSSSSHPSLRNPTSKRPFSTTASKMVAQLQSKQDFNEKLVQAGDKLIVLDFFAEWCGPCKLIAPKIDVFSQQYDDVEFYKIDVDQVGDVAAECGVRAMPTFQFFKGGEKVGEVVGANPAAVKAAIDKYK